MGMEVNISWLSFSGIDEANLGIYGEKYDRKWVIASRGFPSDRGNRLAQLETSGDPVGG